MKKLIYCAMALAVIGCSGGKKPKEVSVTKLEPIQTTLTGDLKDYFQITDKGASINGDVMSVELMRTENDLPFDPDKTNPFGTDGVGEYKEDYHVGFGIEIYDQNGSPILTKSATEGGLWGVYSHEDVENMIRLGSGETAYIRWSITDDVKSAGKTFKITSAIKVENKNMKLKGGDNWDKVLDSYAAYVDKYLKLYKKALSGDASAITEYAGILEKAEELGNKLSVAKGSMTSKQMSRFIEIQNKLTSLN